LLLLTGIGRRILIELKGRVCSSLKVCSSQVGILVRKEGRIVHFGRRSVEINTKSNFVMSTKRIKGREALRRGVRQLAAFSEWDRWC
jgi:hypothetical protein